jgi:c-di-GMP-binding flagellar brake protein YcgR
MTYSQERRQYPRVSLTHVSVEVYDSTGMLETPEFCFIINVSENGMLFKADKKSDRYKEKNRVRLTFTLPENAVVIRTDALIIHSQETDLSVYVGVQFKNLPVPDQKSLQDFIQKTLEKPEN